MARVIVHLLQDEFDALLAVAQAERRSPSDQLGFWARQHLEQAGYLPPAQPKPQPPAEPPRP